MVLVISIHFLLIIMVIEIIMRSHTIVRLVKCRFFSDRNAMREEMNDQWLCLNRIESFFSNPALSRLMCCHRIHRMITKTSNGQ